MNAVVFIVLLALMCFAFVGVGLVCGAWVYTIGVESAMEEYFDNEH